MQLSIATLEDIPALAELLSQLFAQEVEFTPNIGLQTTALHSIISNSAIGEIMLARLEGKIVGMVNLLYTCSTALGGKVCLLEDMVIQPALRGQTIGSQLLDFALEHARAAGCLRVSLLTDSGNAAAQRFYQRKGFNNSSMLPMRILLPPRSQ